MQVAPGIAVGPEDEAPWMRAAVLEAGASETTLPKAEALIWFGTPDQLAPLLVNAPRLRWVQLPSAGIEDYLPLMGPAIQTWTAAKGVYAEPCAEHALGLAIAGFRHFEAAARTRSWHKAPGKTLYDARAVIVGGGGIAQSLIRLLEPFRVHVTVVRRQPEPTPGADRTVPPERLMETLGDADLLVLAAPLTKETEYMVSEDQLRTMKQDAWLINVARGRLVKTDDLVRALQEHWIGGAGLDVTDPEPLPDGHPLWQLDNCLITSHTANPPNLDRELFRRRIIENVRHFVAGERLLGVVDRAAGY
jgi:phosphoglycerate dehydrogenase-like enzyme